MTVAVVAKQMLLAEPTTLDQFHLKCRAIKLPDMEDRTFGYLIKNTESWQY